jgi:hypothetical protein
MTGGLLYALFQECHDYLLLMMIRNVNKSILKKQLMALLIGSTNNNNDDIPVI